eukprot:3513863-Rhodomonas_salina.1
MDSLGAGCGSANLAEISTEERGQAAWMAASRASSTASCWSSPASSTPAIATACTYLRTPLPRHRPAPPRTCPTRTGAAHILILVRSSSWALASAGLLLAAACASSTLSRRCGRNLHRSCPPRALPHHPPPHHQLCAQPAASGREGRGDHGVVGEELCAGPSVGVEALEEGLDGREVLEEAARGVVLGVREGQRLDGQRVARQRGTLLRVPDALRHAGRERDQRLAGAAVDARDDDGARGA